MKKNWIGFGVVSFVYLLLVSILIVTSFKPDKFQGDDILLKMRLNRDNIISVEGDLTIEAVSDEFFVLRNGNNTVLGLSEQKPLGWDQPEYYRVETSIRGGKWIVEVGDNISARLVKSGDMINVEQGFSRDAKERIILASMLITFIVIVLIFILIIIF